MTKCSGRIVLVVQAFPVISETFIVNKFRALYEAGLDVHVVCARTEAANWSKFSVLQDSDELRSRVHRSWPLRSVWLATVLLPIVLLRSLVLRPRATARFLKRGYKVFGLEVFRRFYLNSELILLNPAVVHFEFGGIAPGRMYLGELLNCKLVVSFRGYDLNFTGLDQRDFYSEVWQKADVLHLLGEDLWRSAMKRGCSGDKPKFLIPPAVDSNFFQCERTIPLTVGTSERPLRILSVGRLEWKKGYEYALEAVKLLRDRGIECEYRIIGEGSYFQQLIFACHQFGIAEQVSFPGVCSPAEVRDQMVWADTLVHPAMSEGFCNAVMEAQSMNLPVVCSDAGSLPENVLHNSTGFVVPRRNACEIADRLELLAHDPELRRRMGQAGRTRTIQRFGIEGQIDQFLKLYELVTGTGKSLTRNSGRAAGGVLRFPTGNRQGSKGGVDLIWLGKPTDVPSWELGETTCVEPTPVAVDEIIKSRLTETSAHAWLFWDSELGTPDPVVVNQLLSLPADVWHAGLKLGTRGLPGIIDFITPTWMLNRDPDENLPATSWRVSLRACLIKTEVLLQMGSIRPEFQSLTGAALELGHRLISRGVVTRHSGELVPVRSANVTTLPFEDELRFAYYCFGKFWSKWGLGRAVLTRYVSLLKAIRASREIYKATRPSPPLPFKRDTAAPGKINLDASVSVLIPTLSRRQHLRTLLAQLRNQTVRPLEIIVVNQTPVKDRDFHLSSDFADLPLRILHLDQAGQCSSRNAGLKAAGGDYILFIDDDDEIPPDLIEKHVRYLLHSRADVSSGVAQETGAGNLPEEFSYTRVSNVFPTNNSLVTREALQKSGLFDLAFDRGQRADHDLGMRLYLSGALMMLNPEISVIHHHAPAGGLRTHKARVVTYATSRHRLGVRHLPTVTEIYLAQRYFTARQVREMLWLRTFGTFSIRGGRVKKLLKLLTGSVCLPFTLCQCANRYLRAAELLKMFPQFPQLTSDDRIRNSVGNEEAKQVSVAV